MPGSQVRNVFRASRSHVTDFRGVEDRFEVSVDKLRPWIRRTGSGLQVTVFRTEDGLPMDAIHNDVKSLASGRAVGRIDRVQVPVVHQVRDHPCNDVSPPAGGMIGGARPKTQECSMELELVFTPPGGRASMMIHQSDGSASPRARAGHREVDGRRDREEASGIALSIEAAHLESTGQPAPILRAPSRHSRRECGADEMVADQETGQHSEDSISSSHPPGRRQPFHEVQSVAGCTSRRTMASRSQTINLGAP